MYFDKWVGLMLTIGLAGTAAIVVNNCKINSSKNNNPVLVLDYSNGSVKSVLESELTSKYAINSLVKITEIPSACINDALQNKNFLYVEVIRNSDGMIGALPVRWMIQHSWVTSYSISPGGARVTCVNVVLINDNITITNLTNHQIDSFVYSVSATHVGHSTNFLNGLMAYNGIKSDLIIRPLSYVTIPMKDLYDKDALRCWTCKSITDLRLRSTKDHFITSDCSDECEPLFRQGDRLTVTLDEVNLHH